MGLKRGHRSKPLEWLAEKTIFLVSLTSILMVFLIFVFIGREAIPVALGRMNTAKGQKIIPVEQMDKLNESELQEYLGLTSEEFARIDRETLQTLMELKIETTQ